MFRWHHRLEQTLGSITTISLPLQLPRFRSHKTATSVKPATRLSRGQVR